MDILVFRAWSTNESLTMLGFLVVEKERICCKRCARMDLRQVPLQAIDRQASPSFLPGDHTRLVCQTFGVCFEWANQTHQGPLKALGTFIAIRWNFSHPKPWRIIVWSWIPPGQIPRLMETSVWSRKMAGLEEKRALSFWMCLRLKVFEMF